MRKNNKCIIFLGCLIVTISIFQIVISDLTLFGNDLKSDNNEIIYEDSYGQKLKNSAEIGQGSFADMGLSQNISLYSSRNFTFINQTTEDSGITYNNSVLGWNMTNFDLNFTNLYTTEKYIPFEIRSGDADEFDDNDYYYSSSFEIPNSCYVRNISMLIQYPGGDLTFPLASKFTIRIYNATIDEDSKIVPNETLDDVYDNFTFDLTNKQYQQPARWYQANYTNVILNISKTVNNTYFAVFHAINVPSTGFIKKQGFIFYAFEEPNDQYENIFYKRIPLNDSWIEQTGKNGLLKVNLAPLTNAPTPDQINLTVFGTPVNSSGIYHNQAFFPNENNQFHIPISSLWFNEVKYNVSFLGNFKYNTKSSSTFNATDGKDILWNSTLFINHFPSDSQNNTARFYKPKFWRYNCTYNESVLFNDAEVIVNPNFIDLLNISNNNWRCTFNQTNAILSTQIQSSNNNQTWINIVNFANITDYIKVSVQFNNSNGATSMYIYTSVLDVILEDNITESNFFFPIWRSDQDTGAKENNTQIRLQIHSNNGTMAGIETLAFNVTLSQMNMILLESDSSVYKNNFASYLFSVNNSYNNESLDLDDLIVQINSTSGTWRSLSEYKHYYIDSINTGLLNITIDTTQPDLPAGDYLINFTAENMYFYSYTYNSTLNIKCRSLNMTITGANKENRIFVLGDYATYYIYLNDSITNESVSDVDFSIWVNFSAENGGRQSISDIAYNIFDHNDGDYDITLLTEILFDGRELENLTIEFYAIKIGSYLEVNQNDTFKLSNPPHITNLTILSHSPQNVIYGDTPFVCVRFYDESTAQKENLTNGQFIINNGTDLISSCAYIVSEIPNRYNITFLLDYLDIGYYNLTIKASKARGSNITYNESSINYNLTFIPADFNVDLDPIPVVYTNDLSKSVILNLSYAYGPIETALINAYLGENKLSFALTEPGIFKLFLDSTNLNIYETYKFNITITKIKFNPYFEERSVYIHPYPSYIEIPEDFHNITLYQEQDLDLIVILKDTFRQQDILGAQVRMKIEGFIPYSDEFIPVVSNFGWYQGTLNLGNLNPGIYEVKIEMNASDYTPVETSIIITVLKKENSSLELLNNLKDFYVWDDLIEIEVILKSGENPLANETIIFQIIEISENGDLLIINIPTITDSNGYAIVHHIIGKVDSLEIKVLFDGTIKNRNSSTNIVNIDVRSTTEQFILEFLLLIPFIAGFLLVIASYIIVKSSRKKKRKQIWYEKTNKFSDILNIEYLIVIHKLSGLGLITKEFGQIKFDGTLVSGFLQAITQFKYALKPGAKLEESTGGFKIDYQDYIIFLQDGKFIRLALTLRSEPSENLKILVSQFIEEFEKKYEKYLEVFSGDLRPFSDHMELINQVLKLNLSFPHIVNKNPHRIKLNLLQKNIISLAKTLEIDYKSFFISKLLTYLISALPKKSKEEIVANTYDLIDLRYIIPIHGSI